LWLYAVFGSDCCLWRRCDVDAIIGGVAKGKLLPQKMPEEE